MSAQPDLAAGDFTPWVLELAGALRGERAADVPCAGCTACCTSSQFVHIGPDETDTLAHVPAELLFPAPLAPPGHVVLGYDARGHCPLLVEGRCSIYEHRPRTCRTYDCRVFPAAAVAPGAAAVAERARRWRFGLATAADRARRGAVLAAAAFLREQPHLLPGGAASLETAQHAVLAVELHAAFLRQDGETGELEPVEPALETVLARLGRLRQEAAAR